MLDEQDLATLVLGILRRAEIGTVVTVRPNGAVETEPPGARTPAYERREPLVATFVANRRMPSKQDVQMRLHQGFAKLSGRVA